jgi:hypothetical protein
LAGLFGGICLGALGMILTLPGFLVRDWPELVHAETMVEFSVFIYEQGLMDLSLVGNTFTW